MKLIVLNKKHFLTIQMHTCTQVVDRQLNLQRVFNEDFLTAINVSYHTLSHGIFLPKRPICYILHILVKNGSIVTILGCTEGGV